MSLTAAEIEAVVRELAPLAGSRVDAVHVHAERALTLELYGRAGAARLLLSAETDVTRLHASSARPARGLAPSGFQQVLRRELEGARLAAVEALPGDRVVVLRFEAARGGLGLVAELTGRHGNIFLVGAAGVIRASAGRNLSRRRKLVPGEPYAAPRRAEGQPDEAAPERAEAHEAAPVEAGEERAAPERAEAQGAQRPSANVGRSDRAPRHDIRFVPVEGEAYPLSAAIERHYAAKEEERLLAEGRRRLREPLRAAIARATRALAKLAEEAARVPAAEADRRTADLLKANLRLVRRGQREVTVTEWTEEGPREVKLALDPALTPQANLERCYRRYRRIVDSAARVAVRTAEVEDRERALRALLARVEVALPGELARLEKEARKLGAGPHPAQAPRRNREAPALPYRSFRSLAGTSIRVGKGAAGNDALTARTARGNDLWLHARGVTGAHVVVRLEKGKAPDQETLLDAAHLALRFSDARGAPQADVAYTRVKHVRKPKGAAPGAVTYSQEKVLLLRVEPGRIERLLGEEEAE